MVAQALHLGDRAFAWHMPVALRFGPGSPEAMAQALGTQRAVLLTYAGALRHAMPSRLRDRLGDAVSAVVEVPDGLSSIAAARSLATDLWPRLAVQPGGVLIAVGGGTVLDLAKLLRCRPREGGFDALLPPLRGQGPWPALKLERFWAVPTTAGTGSEVTRWATVWDTEASPAVKRSFDEPFGFAERAFVDPGFAATCPPAVRRDSGLDALSHALEALWNRHANPFSDALALDAARRVIAALPGACAAEPAPDALEAMSLAALQAGLAFAQTRTALAHALSYALTLDTGVPHGLACAVWLPTAWRLALGRDPALDLRLARVFDGPPEAGPACLETWLRDLGVDPRPEAHGVPDAQARIAAALASPRGRNFVGAPA